jgi:dethiobiotin synthetase
VNDSEDIINPVFIPIPVSPYDACKILNLNFEKKVIFDKLTELKNKHKMVLVEGIGGILTPLTRDYFVADLVRDMGLETIIVTRSTLGTLNHTLMTVKTCQNYKIPVKGIIVNNYDKKGGYAENNAPMTIHEITNIPILGVLPFVKDYQTVEMMIPHIERCIDLKSLIS